MKKKADLRSREWFNDSSNPGMTALYLERYLNYGLTIEELQSDRPIIGIAQSGSDLTPCNRHHIFLAERMKAGIRDAGGIPIEFPVHPIQETGRRPTAALDRNLLTLGLIEILHGYPLDAVILTTGCDKITPAMIMAAASVDLPAIALSAGPMLNGHYKGMCVGSGTAIWDARQKLSRGEIDYKEFIAIAAGSAPSTGHCNTMGTALTMNCLAEALGMMLTGCASIPAPYRERQQMAYATGKRIVAMVWEDLTPSKVLTQEAFHNAIVACSAIGGSTNAPIHINAIAKHAGVEVSLSDWQEIGQSIPQIVNCQPTGEYLSEEFHKAGGLPAVMFGLMQKGLLKNEALTVTGKTMGENCSDKESVDARVIKSVSEPIKNEAGLMKLTGNLFDSAIMKISAIDEDFKQRYLQNPDHLNIAELKAVVFDGPEDYHARLNDESLGIDENTILVIRGVGPIGYPGSAEVVNMQAPKALLKRGINALPTMGDGRQSGTSAAPSILNASPEAAAGGNLAILRTGDKVRINLNDQTVNVLISDEEIQKRRETLSIDVPESQTWWQQLHREKVSSLSEGAIFDEMLNYKKISKKKPRHSH